LIQLIFLSEVKWSFLLLVTYDPLLSEKHLTEKSALFRLLAKLGFAVG